MITTKVSSQTSLQVYQFQDYQKNVYSLWWEPKELRLRQVEEYKKALIQSPRNTTLGLALGILLTSLAVPNSERNSPYARQALYLIEEFLNEHPKNAVALAYFCTAKSLIMRNGGNFFELVFQMGTVLDAMDRAVATSVGQQDEWLVRLVRANLFIKLPDLLNRKEVAYLDFQFVVRSAKENPDIEVALPTVYYYLGLIETSRGRSQSGRDYWRLSGQKAEQLGQTSTEEYQDLRRRSQD